jgi:uncharacterized protein (DUF1778 family)
MSAKSDKENLWVTFKVDQELKDRIQAAASIDDRSMSAWCRTTLRKAATRILNQEIK